MNAKASLSHPEEMEMQVRIPITECYEVRNPQDDVEVRDNAARGYGERQVRGIGQLIKKYIVLGLWNTALVYAIYSIYVILWLHFDADQYLRWLAGGIPMSLGTGWLIVRANLWAAKRWFP